MTAVMKLVVIYRVTVSRDTGLSGGPSSAPQVRQGEFIVVCPVVRAVGPLKRRCRPLNKSLPAAPPWPLTALEAALGRKESPMPLRARGAGSSLHRAEQSLYCRRQNAFRCVNIQSKGRKPHLSRFPQ